MKILDANMILRFLLKDDEKSAVIVRDIIKSESVMVLPEIIAEVVYVITRVYKYERIKTSSGIAAFLNYHNIVTEKYDVVLKALQYFGDTSLDFADCLLCAYHTVSGYEICTFDKKLNNFYLSGWKLGSSRIGRNHAFI